jgi:hypothetical protein
LVGLESQFFGRVFCCRCERGAVRLIHGSVCISCYNREREIRIGKNARGTYPSGLKPIGHAALLVVDADVISVRLFDAVTCLKEAVLTYARVHDARFKFGWCPPCRVA